MQWEYNPVNLPSPVTQENFKKWLNDYGDEGWELCGFDYGWAVFKRQVDTKLET